MKPFNIKTKALPYSIIGLVSMIIISVSLNSCTKPGITAENFQASNLRVVNGYVDNTLNSSNVQFYLDSFNLTLTGFLNYDDISEPTYYVVYAGLEHAAFYNTVAKDTFAKENIQLESKGIYSLFLCGSDGAPKFILTKDDLTQSQSDSVKLRFANLAQTDGNVDVTIQSEDTTTAPNPKPEVKVFSNIAPESVSGYAYAAVEPSFGNIILRPHIINVYKAGTDSLLATDKGVDLRGTSIVTIILTGSPNGTPALGLTTGLEWLDW